MVTYKNILRVVSGLASFALTFGVISANSLPAQAAATAASISNVSFRAPVHSTYNHITGGGAWNDGSTTYVKGELLGTDFKCGDVTTYLAQIVTPSSNPGAVTAEFKFDFLGDSTGSSGVALEPLLDSAHLKVNSGVIAQTAGLGTGGTDGGFAPAGYGSTTTASIDRSVAAPSSALVDPAKPLFTSGSSTRTTFRVTGLASNKTNIIRMDARILCQNGSRPTGNLQVSLFNILVGPGTTNETISGGNQTVNFRGVGNLGGLVTPELTVTKTVLASGINCANGAASVSVNVPATVTYCVSVANYSAATAANVRLLDDNGTVSTADDFYVPLTYNGVTSTTVSSLPGGGATATGYYTKTISSPNEVINTVTSSSSTSLVAVKTASASVMGNFVALSGDHISIVKTQSSANPTASSDAIDYVITVTNTGATTLTNVVVTEQAGVTLGACPTVASLASGASFTCTASYLVQPADVTAATFQNTASVVTTQITTPVTSSVTTPIVAPPAVPAWSIIKTQTAVGPFTAVGDTITYDIVVSNLGNVTLTAVSVTDANASIITCAAVSGSDLAPGASMTCQAVHTVDAADLTNHHVDNVAVAHTTYPNFGPTLNSNIVTTNVGAVSLDWTVVKSKSSSTTLTAAGDVVTYDITVTNTGFGVIPGVTITDANAVIGTCDQTNGGDLAVGDSITCSASHVVTLAEVTAGQTVNTAMASSTGSIGPTNSNTVISTITPAATPQAPPAGPSSSPALSIVKALTGQAPSKVGDVATYSLTVTNTGGLSLTGVTVTDANAILGSCSVALPATLAVGASFTCSATHKVTLADLNAGFILNVAVATSTGSNATTSTSNEVTTPLAQVKALTVSKYEIPASKYAQGDSIRYLIVVRNVGNVTVNGISVEDANAVLATCNPAVPTASLEPGQTVVCSATHLISAADFAAGQVLNVASVKIGDGSIQKTSNEVKTVLSEVKAMTISKQVVGDTAYGLGDSIKYQIIVKNTGNVVLNDVRVEDNNAIITSCSKSNPAASLAVDESITCFATHTVTKADVNAGKVVNVAKAKTSTLEVSSEAGAANPDHSTTNSNGYSTPEGIPSNEVVVKIRRASIAGSDSPTVLGKTKRKALAYTGDEPATRTSPLVPAGSIILGGLLLTVLLRRKFSNL